MVFVMPGRWKAQLRRPSIILSMGPEIFSTALPP